MREPIAYREAMCRAVIGEGWLIRRLENRGYLAHHKITLTPAPECECFIDRASAHAPPKAFRKLAEDAI